MRLATTLMVTLACTGAVKIESDPIISGGWITNEHAPAELWPEPYYTDEHVDSIDWSEGDFGVIIDWDCEEGADCFVDFIDPLWIAEETWCPPPDWVWDCEDGDDCDSFFVDTEI